MKTTILFSALMPILLLVLSGCGNRLPIVPVSGAVTLDEKPLEGFRVFFQPAGENASSPQLTASAITDAQGRFQLKTVEDRPRPGVSTGEYRVRISWFDPDGHSVGETEPEREPPIQIPMKYQMEGLSFAVPEGGTKTADFKLTSAD